MLYNPAQQYCLGVIVKIIYGLHSKLNIFSDDEHCYRSHPTTTPTTHQGAHLSNMV